MNEADEGQSDTDERWEQTGDEESTPVDSNPEPSYVDLDHDRADLPDDPAPRPPIEPESVHPEHAVFVIVGVAIAVAVVAGIL
mgnify:FL=1|jgi:hypothetical protein